MKRRLHVRIWPLDWVIIPYRCITGGGWAYYFLCFEVKWEWR